MEFFANIYYNDYVNAKCWYWTLKENDKNSTRDGKYEFYGYNSTFDNFKNYIMVPLKADGSEDLRIYIDSES